MTYLLDVNVLIALIDHDHTAHDTAHEWFERVGRFDWATCPLTENGVLRIVGHPRYPNSPGAPAIVAGILKVLRTMEGHVFWADDTSLLGDRNVDCGNILTSGQVTDTYLLALAKSKGGFLATLDRRLSTAAIHDGASALHIIED